MPPSDEYELRILQSEIERIKVAVSKSMNDPVVMTGPKGTA